jgi:PAS domain S-box-containing protein
MEGSVLIVDDEADVRRVLARQLARAGCRCATAQDGVEGLEQLRSGDFDVVLTDLQMPRMDGISFLKALESEGLDTVAVVLSGHATTAKAVEAMRSGAFDYVEKNSDPRTLEGVVRRAGEHRRLRQRAREMSELATQWQATFDAVPDLIAIVDEEQRLLRVNRAFAARLGRQPEELIGCPCPDIVHGLWYPPPESPENHYERTQKIHEPRLGGDFLVTTSPLWNAQGQFIGSVHVARDVSAQERTEEKLRKAHAETEYLLASMSSFLIGVDEEGRVTRWNARDEATFGIGIEEALGRPFVELPIHWDWDYIRSQVPLWCAATSPARVAELRYDAPTGMKGFLDMVANPIRTSDGRPAGFFLLGDDITERKNLESQLVHAQKMESIGQLAAGIAHEINTPTQYVGDNTRFLQTAFQDLARLVEKYRELAEWARTSGCAREWADELDALAREIDLDYLVAEVPKAIEESLHGVERVAKIVRAMKEFSHPGTAEKTPVDLNRAIESTITVARNEWKYVAEMEFDLDPELPMVSCLPGEFNQVILNMIINAADAIGEVVGDGAQGKGRIRVSTRREDGRVVIRISDTGPGIPEARRQRIFDPFFTTKEVGKGTGQGLAIAHNVIVDKHGGSIAVETEPGAGTTFVVRLPIDGPDPAA